MAGPPSNSFSKITLNFSGAPLPFGAHPGFGFTTPDGSLSAIEGAIQSFGGAIMDVMPNTISLDTIDWKVGPEATGQTVTFVSGLVGAQSTSAAPPNTCWLIQLPCIDISGRYGGRVFMPGVDEDNLDADGTLNPGYAGSLLDAVEAAYAEVGIQGMFGRVFHDGPGSPRTVESIRISLRAATQRRRMRR